MDTHLGSCPFESFHHGDFPRAMNDNSLHIAIAPKGLRLCQSGRVLGMVLVERGITWRPVQGKTLLRTRRLGRPGLGRRILFT